MSETASPQESEQTHDADGVIPPELHMQSYEDVKRLLQEKHGAYLAKDDPLWQVFTVFQSFMDIAFNAHVTLIAKSSKSMSTEVESSVEQIKNAMKPLVNEVLRSQIHLLLEKTREEARTIEGLGIVL